ncbi:MAG: hypothetical protein KIT25_11195 [Enhydrobacter sp.]|nr:MAG: hypothetical protein KIT25_11195 [Enhydrobacter sp.]
MLLKTSTIAACALALSGAAVAQGVSPAPGGATGAGPVESIGTTTPNANATAPGTNSSSVLSHTNKSQSAAGESGSAYTPQAQRMYSSDQAQTGPTSQGAIRGRTGVVDPSAQGPNQVYIVDEYGRRYNREGMRIR